MKTCKNCGERIYKKNAAGYCTRTRECARLNEAFHRPNGGTGSGNWERSGAKPCLNCGTVVATWHGYCNKSVECRRLAYASLKYVTMLAYGGVACACCGEPRLERLSLDHVNGDGHLERDRRSKGGVNYQVLKAQGFPDPDRYQVLCHNCNMEKGVNTRCPCRGQTVLIRLAEQGSPLFAK